VFDDYFKKKLPCLLGEILNSR